jgi:hypothetical protein
VSITDAPTSAPITKSVEKVVCATIRCDVKVTNTSSVDTLTLSALTDTPNGDITKVQGNVVGTTCGVTGPGLGTLSGQTGAGALPVTLAASGGSCSCTFDAANVCTLPAMDTVTGTLTDEDGNAVQQLNTSTWHLT